MKRKKHSIRLKLSKATWRRADKGLFANPKKEAGLSYRKIWMDEGSPGEFEEWLKEKGMEPSKRRLRKSPGWLRG